jgi:hypothetical protein
LSWKIGLVAKVNGQDNVCASFQNEYVEVLAWLSAGNCDVWWNLDRKPRRERVGFPFLLSPVKRVGGQDEQR